MEMLDSIFSNIQVRSLLIKWVGINQKSDELLWRFWLANYYIVKVAGILNVELSMLSQVPFRFRGSDLAHLYLHDLLLITTHRSGWW